MPIIIDENGRREVTQQEYEKYLAGLPIYEQVISEYTIEYSHDVPQKNTVYVKVKELESIQELNYSSGFQWNDEWITQELNNKYSEYKQPEPKGL